MNTTFTITPIDLGGGMSISGTITTDGTVGNLTPTNLKKWNVAVTAVNDLGVFTKANSAANVSLVSTNGSSLTVETAPDAFTEGGTLAFYKRSSSTIIGMAQVADFTSTSTAGGQAYYQVGGAFDWLDLNKPDASLHVAANSSGGNTYNLVPLNFTGSNVTMTGTIMTDGTAGPLTAANLLDWSILVREEATDLFTEANSTIFSAFANVSSDGSHLFVANPDGNLEFFKGYFSLHKYSVQLADFTNGNNQAGYYHGRLLAQTADAVYTPLASVADYAAAAVPVPEPASIALLLFGVAMLVVRRRVARTR